MEPGRPDLPALFQRLADTVVRLFDEQIGLARIEFREDVSRLLGLAVRLLFGVVAAGIGTVMLATAATDLLKPWVADRATRLVLVGAPLLVAGLLRALV